MISIGIFSGYYPFSLQQTIEELKKAGIHSVQLDLKFTDFPELLDKHKVADNLTKDKAHTIRDAFRNADIEIVAISGYTNVLAPVKETRQKNIQYLKTMLAYARDFGTSYVVSETGTYSQVDDYHFDEQNHLEATYLEFKEILRDLVQYASEHDAMLVIEPYVNNAICSVDVVKRIFKDVHHPALGLLMDPSNYFTPYNIQEMGEMLVYMFQELGDKVVLAHAKDVCKQENTCERMTENVDEGVSHVYRGSGGMALPAAGKGHLNYNLYIALLAKYHPNIPIIIEHLEMADIPRAKQFLKTKLKEESA